MNRHLLVPLTFMAGLVCAEGGAMKTIMAVAPSLADLGPGWTTNSVVSVVDPLSRPSQKPEKAAIVTGQTSASPAAMKLPGQTGWGRFQYGHGDMVINRGAYFVSIQRWSDTNVLNRAWQQWKEQPGRVVRSVPSVGEDAFLSQSEAFRSLTFRRGLFHVVAECGQKSDPQHLLQLAKAIDTKISRPAK